MARLTHDSALTVYLGLGGDRGLRKVAERVPPEDRVSVKTLKQWSSKYGWTAKAKAHDAEVAARAQAGLLVTQAKEAVTAAIAMERFSTAAFVKAAALVEAATTVEEAGILVDKAIDAQKQLAVMTGGVSDRTEQLGAAKTPAERAKELEAKYGFGRTSDAAAAKPH